MKSVTRLTTTLFHTIESAERAYHYALANGYSNEEIFVLMSKEYMKKYSESPLVTKAKAETPANRSIEGIGIGGVTGVALGGFIAALAAMGTSVIIPCLEIVVAGPIAAGLAGAGAGSITGGLVGALIGFGIPEDLAQRYESDIIAGGIVLGVYEHSPQARVSTFESIDLKG